MAVTLARSENLDDFLVGAGRITEEDRHRAIHEMALGFASIEEILLGMGVIDEAGLEDALQECAGEEIFKLFELPKGRFRFEPGRRLKGARSLDITRSAQSLIVRGVLAWSSLDTVRTALARYGDLYVIAGARPEPDFDDVPFSDAQRDFINGLSGNRTVNDFLGGSEFEQRTLYAFAVLGVIDLCPNPMLVLEEVLEEAPRADLPAQETPAPPLAIEEQAFDFADCLFDAELGEPSFSDEPAPDRSYEDDLFEQRVFDEDSFEREMLEVEGAASLPFEPERPDEGLVEIGEILPEVSEPAPVPEPEPERVDKPRTRRKPRSDKKKGTSKHRKPKRRKKVAARKKKKAAPAPTEPPPPEPISAPIGQDVPEPTSPVAAPEPEAPTRPSGPTRAAEKAVATPKYEIAPFGSIQTDAQERIKLARHVQKRLQRRYGHLVDRLAEASAASAGSDGSAARALEAESWFRKGRDLLKSKKYEKAVEAFGMSAHLEPTEGEYVAHLGYALYLSQPGDEVVRKEALENIARGIKLSPDREISYVYLGRIFKVMGDVDVAKKMFMRAVRIRPHCPEAASELRLMEMREQKKGGFLGRFRK